MSQSAFLSVMMPVFNEERTLEIILGHVLQQPEVGEVIAVDDGSTDRSWEMARHHPLAGRRNP
jgi:glycosyltransferase involved in cell wall biosynthesis